ncbi:MAG: amidase [Burkholderiaceae bacterium]
MPHRTYPTVARLARSIRERETTSEALLEHYLDRVAAFNPALNAIVTLDVDGARAQARAADAALAKGRTLGPLHGVPMSVKDTFETAGVRTTAGAPPLAEHVPKTDAVAIERLRQAGAVIFGKTNTPTMAMDLQSYNPIFGTTNNPWDLARSPGGSSGGSAAALAADLTPLELGSDIGGSIRTPAHFCGVFGHKPSFGLIPARGHIPGPPGSLQSADIAVLGPLARDADDLMLALDVLAGPDSGEARAWRLELPKARGQRLSDFRIAAWLDDPVSPVDASVAAVHHAAIERLRAAGAAIDVTARPGFTFAEARDVYLKLLYGATAPGLPLAQFQRLIEDAPHRTDDGSGYAIYAEGSIQRHRDWLITHERRERLRRAWSLFFERYDVLLCPVTQTAAILHDQSEPISDRRIEVNGRATPYFEQLFWVGIVGAAYLPSTSAPAGQTVSGLPVGMQIVGPYLEDRTTIAFAKAVQDTLGGFVAPRGY